MTFAFKNYELEYNGFDEEGNEHNSPSTIISPVFKNEIIADIYPTSLSFVPENYGIPEKELNSFIDESEQKQFSFYMFSLLRSKIGNENQDGQISYVSDECIDSLLSLSPSIFPVDLFLDFGLDKDKCHMFTNGTIIKTSNNLYLRLIRPIELSSWNYPFDAKTFCTYMAENFEFDGQVTYSQSFQNLAVLIKFDGSDIDNNIMDRILDVGQRLSSFYDKSLFNLNQGKSLDTLIKVFNFPEQYETICTQYILWFGEFLSGLGVKTRVSNIQGANQTTFIIHPSTDNILISDIEKLFYTYLGLPCSDNLLLEANALTSYNDEYIGKQVQNYFTQMEDKTSIIDRSSLVNDKGTCILNTDYRFTIWNSLEDEKKYEFFDKAVSIPSKQSLFKNKNITFDIQKLIDFARKKLSLIHEFKNRLENKSKR